MICVIPARKGSTRIPLKNIKEFHGKPIIEYSIETAEKSKLFRQIIVSTDSVEIKRVVNEISDKLNIFVHVKERVSELAANDIGTQDVVKDVMLNHATFETNYSIDITCCLYATSPLLSIEDLTRGVALLKRNPNMQYAFSVGTEPLRDAGNFYWGRREAFLADIPVHAEHSIMVPLPEERVCDINTPEDWAEAEEKYRKLYGSEI